MPFLHVLCKLLKNGSSEITIWHGIRNIPKPNSFFIG